jgi:DNA-binding transcriptional regulator/RsmH inhibitor MraZ
MADETDNGDFCFGEFESRIDEASRLRLTRRIIRQVEGNGIFGLWIFPSPLVKAVVLCPGQTRQRYIDYAQPHFPKEMDPEMAYRKFICTSRIGQWDCQGRLYIPSSTLGSVGLKLYSAVVILGIGPWYEIWDYNTWLKGTA